MKLRPLAVALALVPGLSAPTSPTLLPKSGGSGLCSLRPGSEAERVPRRPAAAGSDVRAPHDPFATLKPVDATVAFALTPTSPPASSQFPLSTPPGSGAAADAIIGKLGRLEVSAADFGVKCDGVTDDGPAINRALNSMAYRMLDGPKRVLVLGGPVCATRQQIRANAWSSLALVGRGSAAGGRAGTTLKWIGAPMPGAVVLIDSPGDGHYTSGLTLDGFNVDADNRAGYGIQVRTMARSHWGSVAALNATVADFDIDVGPLQNSAAGTQINTFDQLYAQNDPTTTATGAVASGSTSVLLTAADPRIAAGQHVFGQGIVLGTTVASVDGKAVTLSTAANAPFAAASLWFDNTFAVGIIIGRGAEVTHVYGDVNSNIFHNITVLTAGGDGFVCGAADANTVDYLRTQGPPGSGATQPIPGPTVGLRLEGSTLTSATPGVGGSTTANPDPLGDEACRWNTFHNTQVNGQIAIENGVVIAANASANSYPAQHNRLDGIGSNDSFTFINDYNNASGTSTSKGNGDRAMSYFGSDDNGNLFGFPSIAASVVSAGRLAFTGDAPATSCGKAVDNSTSSSFVVGIVRGTGSSCTVTFPATAFPAGPPNCLASAYSSATNPPTPIAVAQGYTDSKTTALFYFASAMAKGGALRVHCI